MSRTTPIPDISEIQNNLLLSIRAALSRTTTLTERCNIEDELFRSHIRQRLTDSKVFAMLPKTIDMLPIIEIRCEEVSLRVQSFVCFDKTTLNEMVAVLEEEGKDEATIACFVETWMAFETWYFSLARTLWSNFPRDLTHHYSYHIETSCYCQQHFNYSVMDVFDAFFGISSPESRLAILCTESQLLRVRYKAALVITKWKKNAEKRTRHQDC